MTTDPAIGESWDVALQAAQDREQGRIPTDTARPRFFMKSLYNKRESELQGRPIYRDTEMVEIVTVSDPKNIPVMPVRESHKIRFAAQYKAWKETEKTPVVGTPLEEWTFISREQAMELKASRIQTVEELATIADVAIPQNRPWHSLREHARNWLKQAKENAGLIDLQGQIDDLKRRTDNLLEANESLQLENRALKADQSKPVPVAATGEDDTTDVDKAGQLWSAELHDPQKRKTKAGLWRKRAGRK